MTTSLAVVSDTELTHGEFTLLDLGPTREIRNYYNLLIDVVNLGK